MFDVLLWRVRHNDEIIHVVVSELGALELLQKRSNPAVERGGQMFQPKRGSDKVESPVQTRDRCDGTVTFSEWDLEIGSDEVDVRKYCGPR